MYRAVTENGVCRTSKYNELQQLCREARVLSEIKMATISWADNLQMRTEERMTKKKNILS